MRGIWEKPTKHFGIARMRVRTFLILALVPLCCRSPALADWPTYRHDASRSGWTLEQVALPLHLKWRHRAPQAPRPAWPAPAYGNLLQNIASLNKWDISDHASHAVCADGLVAFASSVDDAVYCLDLADGTLRWKFVADAPIRMPPTFHRGHVYAGTDDGQVYCLQATSGDVVWARRIGPENRWAPGNGRIISRWPVRGGPLVQDDTVFVAAGVFPLEGVFLAALDARQGTTRWFQSLDVVAHGPMVASSDRLFVSALRGNPSMFDLKSGALLGSMPGAGSLATFGRDKLISGPSETGALSGVEKEIQQALAVREGFQLVITDDLIFAASNQALVAFDAQLKQQWKAPRKHTCSLIVAGDTVFAGGDGNVAAYDAKQGQLVWRHDVAGKALSLAAAENHLVVSTDQGEVVCLSANASNLASRTIPEQPAIATGSDVTRQATEILRYARTKAGYALVVGANDEQLPAALAEQTRLQVVSLCPDPTARTALRQRLDLCGLYGARVTLHGSADGLLSYQSQIFNLVVVECEASQPPELPVQELVRLLQPANGVLVVRFRGDFNREQFTDWCESLEGWQLEQSADGMLAVYLAKPAKGSGEWSHPFADPGNSACSQDELVRSPFELQWFGPPGPQYIVDRHNRTSPPLFKDGRLFIPGRDRLTAVDAYNGTVLWEKLLEGSTRLAVSKNCGHVVVGSAHVYVASADQCHVLKADSGELDYSFQIPLVEEQTPREWGYLALANGVLLGSVGRQEAARKKLSSESWQMGYLDFSLLVTSEMLFAFDAKSRAPLWQDDSADCAMINATFAADGEQVYYVQSSPLEAQQVETGRVQLSVLFAKPANLIARDLRTGKTVWTKPLTIAPQHSLFLTAAQGLIVVAGSRNDGNSLICDLRAFDSKTGEPAWEASEPTGFNAGGSHGEQEQHPLVVENSIYFKTFACNLLTGAVSRTWRVPIGGCGALSASKHTAFFRAGASFYADLSTGASQPITGVTRPGCWLNMLPAGGLLLAPESSAGCTCQYPIQTSLAMRPLAGPPPDVLARFTPNDELKPLTGDLEFAGRIRLEVKPQQADAIARYAWDDQWPTLASAKFMEPIVVDRSAILWVRNFMGEQPGGIARRRLMRAATPRLRTPSTEFVTTAKVELASYPGEAKIRYQLDGQSPTAKSTEYSAPFDVDQTCRLTAAYFLDDQRTGPDLTVEFLKVPGRPADKTGDVERGLAYDYFEGDGWTKLPDFPGLTPLRSGNVPLLRIPPQHRPDGFAVRYTGYLEIPADGMYVFFLRSDDGSELRIGDKLIVSNDGIHDARGESRAQTPLAAGKHRMEVRFFDGEIGEVLWVGYEGPGIRKREIPGEVLWREVQAPSAAPNK